MAPTGKIGAILLRWLLSSGGARHLGRNAAKNLRRGLYIRRSSPFDYRTGVTRKPQHRPIEKPVPPRGNALTPPPASGFRVFPDRAEHRSHDMIWARYVGHAGTVHCLRLRVRCRLRREGDASHPAPAGDARMTTHILEVVERMVAPMRRRGRERRAIEIESTAMSAPAMTSTK